MKRRIIIFSLITILTYFAHGQEIDSNYSMRLVLPGKTWTLQFDIKDFEIWNHKFLADFKGENLEASNKKNHLEMSVFIVPAEKRMTSKEYREFVFNEIMKSPINKSELRKYEQGEMAFTEYLIRKITNVKGGDQRLNDVINKMNQDRDLNQKNVFIYLVKDDCWIDFHLSKVFFTEEDKYYFSNFVDSIKIIDPYKRSSFENFRFGSYFYKYQNYNEAIRYYKEALEQEKANQELSDVGWLVLVDNLGISMQFLEITRMQ